MRQNSWILIGAGLMLMVSSGLALAIYNIDPPPPPAGVMRHTGKEALLGIVGVFISGCALFIAGLYNLFRQFQLAKGKRR